MCISRVLETVYLTVPIVKEATTVGVLLTPPPSGGGWEGAYLEVEVG